MFLGENIIAQFMFSFLLRECYIHVGIGRGGFSLGVYKVNLTPEIEVYSLVD